MLDTSVFKKLAHNDTGAAKGHQGGIVVPKDIAEFFPPLPRVAATGEPTVDSRLKADLFVDGYRVAVVETRYQHQTWGGTRSPERRLTDNLGPLRNVATRDDIVLFNKDLTDDGFIQIHLLRKGTAEYDKLNSRLGSQRWGIVDPDHPPVSLREIEEATVYIDDKISKPAKAFGDDRATKEVISIRKARDRAFRERVLSQYEYRCAFTSRKFVSPSSSKTVGLDAAHIVPVDLNGSDHPANGLALSKDMHWAFDRGLVGISKDRTVFVSKKVGDLDGNEFLRDLHGKPIGQTTNPGLGVLEEALEWHRSNVLIT